MVHLRGPVSDALIELSAGIPVVVHYGQPLPAGSELDWWEQRPATHGALDDEPPLSVVPMHGDGFYGRPGLEGHRQGGRAWAPRFTYESHAADEHSITCVAVDPIAELRLTTTISLDHLLHVRSAVTNTAPSRYLIDRLDVSIPLPASVDELLTFHGRWTREFQQARMPWIVGAWSAENRRGKTSHDHPSLLYAGRAGFGEWDGEVWGFHLAWSGNHRLWAEHLADGRRYVQAGELLHPGEICLEAGETYETPELLVTHAGNGLTPASWGFHRSLRARATSPSTPRKVLINTWEAVYFDHDLERLKQLADVAASIGVERFVLDDGWFGSRRDDTSGLGDWWVSPDAHPGGLAPLIDHVHRLGMDFGIWVEPEMVNPDSDLYRAHPDWMLATPGYEHVTGRHQVVLNLAIPEAFDHILGQLDALLTDHVIAFVKWDQNRDQAQASGAGGAAGTHAQVLAVNRLFDELGERHPQVEFESCASGGGRIDHEILRRTVRVWTSDCNDPLERQSIQRGASMLIPPEVMGAHIGPPQAHTTGRTASLQLRALTAMAGHLGIEWNVLQASDGERAELATYIELYRRFRRLLHSGDTVRFDPIANGQAYGVYAPDRSEALVWWVQLATDASLLPPSLVLRDLAPQADYRVERLVPFGGYVPTPGKSEPRWWEHGTTMPGDLFGTVGLQLPVMRPESAVLIHLQVRPAPVP
jgi:alpha-galactosidase